MTTNLSQPHNRLKNIYIFLHLSSGNIIHNILGYFSCEFIEFAFFGGHEDVACGLVFGREIQNQFAVDFLGFAAAEGGCCGENLETC